MRCKVESVSPVSFATVCSSLLALGSSLSTIRSVIFENSSSRTKASPTATRLVLIPYYSCREQSHTVFNLGGLGADLRWCICREHIVVHQNLHLNIAARKVYFMELEDKKARLCEQISLKHRNEIRAKMELLGNYRIALYPPVKWKFSALPS